MEDYVEDYMIIGYTKKSNIPYIGYNEKGHRLYLLCCKHCGKEFSSSSTTCKICLNCRNELRKRKEMKGLMKKELKKKIRKNRKRKNSQPIEIYNNSDINFIYKNIIDKKYDNDEYFKVFDIIEVRNRLVDTIPAVCITTQDKYMKYLTFINLINSFFKKYSRFPNKRDRIFIPSVNKEKRIYDLSEDYELDLDLVVKDSSTVFYRRIDAIKYCHCGELFSKRKSGYMKYCSKACYEQDNQKIDYIKFDNKKICKKNIKKIKKKTICNDDIQKTCDKDISIEETLEEVVSDRVIEILDKSKITPNTFNDVLINYYNISGFNDTLKTKVRNRDDNMCQICGKNYELEVHHIIPRRVGGSHDKSNLITLCSGCHRAIETGNKDYAIKKCVKNALIYGGYIKPIKLNINDSYRLDVVKGIINRVIEDLSKDINYEELLIYIDDTLDSINM